MLAGAGFEPTIRRLPDYEPYNPENDLSRISDVSTILTLSSSIAVQTLTIEVENGSGSWI